MANTPKGSWVQPEQSGIPDKALLQVKVTSMEEKILDDGRLIMEVLTRVQKAYVNGEEYNRCKNFSYDFTFYLGTHDDKEAEKDETWLRFPNQQYGRFLIACGYKADSFRTTAEAAEVVSNDKPQLVFTNSKQASKKPGADPEKLYNNPTKFVPVGNADTEAANGLDKTVKRVAPMATKKVAAVEAYVEDDE